MHLFLCGRNFIFETSFRKPSLPGVGQRTQITKNVCCREVILVLVMRTDVLGQDAMHLVNLLMHAAILSPLLIVRGQMGQLLLQDAPKVELGAQVLIKF